MGFWAFIRDRLLRRRGPHCPECGGGLLVRNWIRATRVDEQGDRHPDSWTYESCEACGFRAKRHLDGRVEAPSEEEWHQHVRS